MKKPGIWDPFRQEVPAPPKTTAPAVDDFEVNDETKELRCISFPGERYGVNVWVEDEDDDNENVARNRLARVLCLLFRNTQVVPTLSSAGISLGAKPEGVVIGGDTAWAVTIIGPSPIEQVARALRELERANVTAKSTLAKYGVVPYLKV